MGAHICQFGKVHKMCRCTRVHTISCPTPEECAKNEHDPYVGKHRKPDALEAFSSKFNAAAAQAAPVTDPTISDDFKDAGFITEFRLKPRLLSCVEQWPGCSEGDYHPSCCRFPKSCSCTVYPDNIDPELLEKT